MFLYKGTSDMRLGISRHEHLNTWKMIVAEESCAKNNDTRAERFLPRCYFSESRSRMALD